MEIVNVACTIKEIISTELFPILSYKQEISPKELEQEEKASTDTNLKTKISSTATMPMPSPWPIVEKSTQTIHSFL